MARPVVHFSLPDLFEVCVSPDGGAAAVPDGAVGVQGDHSVASGLLEDVMQHRLQK